jgi:hypothetical protein
MPRCCPVLCRVLGPLASEGSERVLFSTASVRINPRRGQHRYSLHNAIASTMAATAQLTSNVTQCTRSQLRASTVVLEVQDPFPGCGV